MDPKSVSLGLDNVRLALNEFNVAWSSQVRAGEVYELPLIAERALPERVKPSAVKDTSIAALAACYAIARLERVEGQHPNRTLRLPGWFALSDMDETLFDRLNKEKDKLKVRIPRDSAMGEIPLAQRKLVAAAHKGIAFLQAYRHVTYLEQTPERQTGLRALRHPQQRPSREPFQLRRFSCVASPIR